MGLVVDQAEGPVERRMFADRADQGIADQVREGDLPAAVPGQEVVDHAPVVGHQLGRDGPHRCGGRHIQGRRHVLRDSRCGAAQRVGRWTGSPGRSGGRGRCGGSRYGWPGGHGRVRGHRCGFDRDIGRCPGWCVVGDRVAWSALGEEIPPDRIDSVGVGQELLILLFDEPVIGAERRGPADARPGSPTRDCAAGGAGGRFDRRSHVQRVLRWRGHASVSW